MMMMVVVVVVMAIPRQYSAGASAERCTFVRRAEQQFVFRHKSITFFFIKYYML